MSKAAAKVTKSKTASTEPKAKAPSKKVAAKKEAPAAGKVAKPKKSSAAPAVKTPKAKASPTAVTTTIVAAIDVGFGNHLALRGEGPGLSWDAGVVLDCVADDRWSITLPESSQPIICKFLLNDTTWCLGEDYTILPGSSVVLSPQFPA